MNKFRHIYGTWFRVAILLCWLVFVALLIKRDVIITPLDTKTTQTLLLAETEEFQSVYFQNSKIGYVANSYQRQPDNSWLLIQSAELNLNIANQVQKISLDLEARLSASNSLKSFVFNFISPFYKMAASGSVNGNTVKYELNTTTSSIHNQFNFTAPPLLATTRRGYLLSDNMAVGDKRKIPWFDPISLTGKESVLEYRGLESVLINGRVMKLHKFIETFSGVRVNSWLNGDGVVIKEESPAGFIFLREPKFKALSLPESSKDILSQVAVKISGEMVDPSSKSISYRLNLPDDVDFELNSDNQRFVGDILTVTKPDLPESPGSNACSEGNKYLGSSAYIQTEHKEIQQLSRKLIENEKNVLTQAKNLSSWVYSNLEKRSVIGLPDALTTLRSLQGDCNEHAALFTALARASAIPTRIIAGVTYHQNAFYYHAWNEICLGQNWIPIDTTTNQFPADATHIRIIEGEIQEQVKVGALLGRLSIEPIHDKPARLNTDQER